MSGEAGERPERGGATEESLFSRAQVCPLVSFRWYQKGDDHDRGKISSRGPGQKKKGGEKQMCETRCANGTLWKMGEEPAART